MKVGEGEGIYSLKKKKKRVEEEANNLYNVLRHNHSTRCELQG